MISQQVVQSNPSDIPTSLSFSGRSLFLYCLWSVLELRWRHSCARAKGRILLSSLADWPKRRATIRIVSRRLTCTTKSRSLPTWDSSMVSQCPATAACSARPVGGTAVGGLNQALTLRPRTNQAPRLGYDDNLLIDPTIILRFSFHSVWKINSRNKNWRNKEKETRTRRRNFIRVLNRSLQTRTMALYSEWSAHVIISSALGYGV